MYFLLETARTHDTQAGHKQGCGSGLDPDSIGSVDPDPEEASSVTWTFFMEA